MRLRRYDSRREESLEIMRETGRRKERIVDAIGTIEQRLKRLDAEMAELRRYRDLEKQRKVAEVHARKRLSPPRARAPLWLEALSPRTIAPL